MARMACTRAAVSAHSCLSSAGARSGRSRRGAARLDELGVAQEALARIVGDDPHLATAGRAREREWARLGSRCCWPHPRQRLARQPRALEEAHGVCAGDAPIVVCAARAPAQQRQTCSGGLRGSLPRCARREARAAAQLPRTGVGDGEPVLVHLLVHQQRHLAHVGGVAPTGRSGPALTAGAGREAPVTRRRSRSRAPPAPGCWSALCCVRALQHRGRGLAPAGSKR